MVLTYVVFDNGTQCSTRRNLYSELFVAPQFCKRDCHVSCSVPCRELHVGCPGFVCIVMSSARCTKMYHSVRTRLYFVSNASIMCCVLHSLRSECLISYAAYISVASTSRQKYLSKTCQRRITWFTIHAIWRSAQCYLPDNIVKHNLSDDDCIGSGIIWHQQRTHYLFRSYCPRFHGVIANVIRSFPFVSCIIVETFLISTRYELNIACTATRALFDVNYAPRSRRIVMGCIQLLLSDDLAGFVYVSLMRCKYFLRGCNFHVVRSALGSFTI